MKLKTAKPTFGAQSSLSFRLFAASLVTLVLVLLPGIARADKVTDWNAIAATAIGNAGRGGAVGTIDLAYVHIAIYDSVNAIDGRYTVFAVSPSSVPPGASPDAATVEAAYRVLRSLLPTQGTFLDAQYTASLATIPDGSAKADGMAVGAEVAASFLASRIGDGRNAPITFTPGSGPGAWLPTASSAPANVWAAYMRPFAILSPSQFRSDPPPALDSVEWAADYNEVRRVGSINSAERTPEQTALGRFFIDVATVQMARGVRRLAIEQGLSLTDNARLFALQYVSQADATIAGFDSKYHFAFWRPITAIRNGDTDGNPDTDADPTWTPLAPTPNHPEYLSAHSFASGAYTQALDDFFGTKKLNVVLTSDVSGLSMTFDNTDELNKALIDARIFAGFHFRTSCVRGMVLGRRVAKYVEKNFFQPVDPLTVSQESAIGRATPVLGATRNALVVASRNGG